MGRLLLLVMGILSLGVPGAEALETPHFRFVHDDKSAGMAEQLAKVAEDKRRYVLNLLGIADERVVEVRIAATDSELSEMVGVDGPVKEWIAGLAMSDRNLIVMSNRGTELFSAGDIFVHELGHLYLDTAIGHRRVPRWFHEGFAMLVASEDVARRFKTLLYAAATGSFLDLAALCDSFPMDVPAVHLAYAESMFFLRFLQRRHGVEGLKQLIGQIRNGFPFDLAFAEVYGGPPESLWRSFERTLNPWAGLVGILTSTAVIWVLITLLFIWVYGRKRRRAELRRKAWAVEEELARSTPDDTDVN